MGRASWAGALLLGAALGGALGGALGQGGTGPGEGGAGCPALGRRSCRRSASCLWEKERGRRGSCGPAGDVCEAVQGRKRRRQRCEALIAEGCACFGRKCRTCLRGRDPPAPDGPERCEADAGEQCIGTLTVPPGLTCAEALRGCNTLNFPVSLNCKASGFSTCGADGSDLLAGDSCTYTWEMTRGLPPEYPGGAGTAESEGVAPVLSPADSYVALPVADNDGPCEAAYILDKGPWECITSILTRELDTLNDLIQEVIPHNLDVSDSVYKEKCKGCIYVPPTWCDLVMEGGLYKVIGLDTLEIQEFTDTDTGTNDPPWASDKKDCDTKQCPWPEWARPINYVQEAGDFRLKNALATGKAKAKVTNCVAGGSATSEITAEVGAKDAHADMRVYIMYNSAMLASPFIRNNEICLKFKSKQVKIKKCSLEVKECKFGKLKICYMGLCVKIPSGKMCNGVEKFIASVILDPFCEDIMGALETTFKNSVDGALNNAGSCNLFKADLDPDDKKDKQKCKNCMALCLPSLEFAPASGCPQSCTLEGGDPLATGREVKCCEGTGECPGYWNGSSISSLRCEPSRNCPDGTDCIKKGKDPFASGTEVVCCPGLEKCGPYPREPGDEIWVYSCEEPGTEERNCPSTA